MATTRKQIAFDLDTKALQTHYPTFNWRDAYERIKRHMKNYDFQWQQGSVYTSIKPMKATDAQYAIKDLVIKYPWLHLCMRDCTVTNIGRAFNLNHFFNKSSSLDVYLLKEVTSQQFLKLKQSGLKFQFAKKNGKICIRYNKKDGDKVKALLNTALQKRSR